MHQATKGKNCYFGMKAHVSVESKTKVVTATNVSDTAVLADLLHAEETRAWGDGCRSADRTSWRDWRDFGTHAESIRLMPRSLEQKLLRNNFVD